MCVNDVCIPNSCTQLAYVPSGVGSRSRSRDLTRPALLSAIPQVQLAHALDDQDPDTTGGHGSDEEEDEEEGGGVADMSEDEEGGKPGSGGGLNRLFNIVMAGLVGDLWLLMMLISLCYHTALDAHYRMHVKRRLVLPSPHISIY